MKDKIVKFFNNIKNHAVKFFVRIKGHFVKHKQRYIRLLLVVLCVYLVLLALCSIGRCTRKNVLTANAFGESTDTYFEVPVVLGYNSASVSSSTLSTYTLSTPVFLRLSRNLDFLGVSSYTSDGGSEFISAKTPTHYEYDGVGGTLVETSFSSGGPVSTSSTVDNRLIIDYFKRPSGAYPAITQCNVEPTGPVTTSGTFPLLRVKLVNWSDNVETVICVFNVSAKTFDGVPYTFLGYDLSYSISISDSYANGYASGREAGYNEGYSRGYANGSQTVSGENQFTALMNAIVFVPINTLWNVLNFEILGVNVFMFVTAVITVLVVIWLWGKLK